MSDDEESKKRRGVMSPGEEPVDKQQRSNSPPGKSKADDLHPSILTSRDMMTTPINVLSHPFVIANSRLQNLRSPVSIENLHSMVTQLDSRLNKQEKEISDVKRQLKAKEEENADLRQQLQIARGDTHGATPMDIDSEFLGTLRTEFPLLSEGLGKAEGDITKVGEDLRDLNRKIETLQKQLKSTERKCHLEGDQRDQYSRRDTIRVSGVPYKRGEDTNDNNMQDCLLHKCNCYTFGHKCLSPLWETKCERNKGYHLSLYSP